MYLFNALYIVVNVDLQVRVIDELYYAVNDI